MAQTLTRLLTHIVFSTKGRRPWICTEIESELYGYPRVGILGATLSAEQEELLCKYFPRVVLLFDGDDAGRGATEDCVVRLARRVFVKAIGLSPGKQPDMLSREELAELLG